MQNQNNNYLRQQHIDVLDLYKINKKLSMRPAIAPRLDTEDRLAYIREQKAKLNMNSFLLKSSKRAVIDSQLKKDMPALEFDGMFRNITQEHIFTPDQMHWSTYEFNKPHNQAEMEQKQIDDFPEYINNILNDAKRFDEEMDKVKKEDQQ